MNSHIYCASLASLVVMLAGCASGVGPEEKTVSALRLAVSTATPKADVLAGRVVDEAGKPVVDAKVRCWPDDLNQRKTYATNNQGYFSTEPLSPGRWRARVEHASYSPGHVLEFAVGSERPLPLVLFQLCRGGALHVQLTDAQQNPARRARVMVIAPDELIAVLRDSGKGSYESEIALPEGELSLHVIASGFAPLEQKFSLKAGEKKTIELTLIPLPGSPPPATPPVTPPKP